jgi:hypothetical protein
MQPRTFIGLKRAHLDEFVGVDSPFGELVDEGERVFKVERQQLALEVLQHRQRESVHHVGSAPQVQIPHPAPPPNRPGVSRRREKEEMKGKSVPEHDREGKGAQEDVHVPLGRVHGCLDARLGLAIAVNVNKSITAAGVVAKPSEGQLAGGKKYEVSVEGGEVALEQLFVHGEALEQPRKAL